MVFWYAWKTSWVSVGEGSILKLEGTSLTKFFVSYLRDKQDAKPRDQRYLRTAYPRPWIYQVWHWYFCMSPKGTQVDGDMHRGFFFLDHLPQHQFCSIWTLKGKTLRNSRQLNGYCGCLYSRGRWRALIFLHTDIPVEHTGQIQGTWCHGKESQDCGDKCLGNRTQKLSMQSKTERPAERSRIVLKTLTVTFEKTAFRTILAEVCSFSGSETD